MGLVTVRVGVVVDTPKLTALAPLLSKYPWTGLYGRLEGLEIPDVLVEIWIVEKTLAAFTTKVKRKSIPLPFTEAKIVSWSRTASRYEVHELQFVANVPVLVAFWNTPVLTRSNTQRATVS